MILTYREGCCGSWLAELLTLGGNTRKAFFRQDRTTDNLPNFPNDVLHFDGNIDDHVLSAKLRYSNQSIITCHNTNYELLHETWPTKNIVRIHPITGIYQCISAAFHKMGNIHTTVDGSFEFIKDYYGKYASDKLPDAVINYGDLSNMDSLMMICGTYGVTMQDNHVLFATDYWKLQKFVVDDTKLYNGITKDELFELFSKEESIFNLACFIFVYEKYNNLREDKRRWTIDNVPNNFEELIRVMVYE